MTKLEQNNLDAQVSLMKDIIQNDRHIIYGVTERGKELLSTLRAGKKDDNVPTKDRIISFNNEQYELLISIAQMISNESKFDQLGILAKNAVPDNQIKREILSLLQK